MATRPRPTDGPNPGERDDQEATKEGFEVEDKPLQFRLYKRRWLGLFGLAVLNIVAGLNGGYFGAIANDVSAEFQISLTQVNWLSNAVNVCYIPSSILATVMCRRYGIRLTAIFGSTIFLLAAWIRYSGTIATLSPSDAYALLVVSQVLIGIAQPAVQVIGTRYSELWFDLNGRQTASMVLGIAQPVGGALGSLIAPLPSTTRTSILILGAISSAVFPASFMVLPQPPLPPTYAGSRTSPPVLSTFRAYLGLARPGERRMTKYERTDITIVVLVFGVLVAATGAFGNFSAEILGPYGYSSKSAGLMSASLLLAGIVAAVISAPLYDRFLHRYLSVTVRVLLPVLMACWIGMIFNVKPNNTAALFAVLAVIGVASFILLPIALELGCEITGNAEASCAALWSCSNLFAVIFIVVEDALRDDSSSADPPHNMRRALIFTASVISAVSLTVIFLRGEQTRRNMDVLKAAESKRATGRVLEASDS